MSDLTTKKEFAEYVTEKYDQDPNGRFDRFGKEYIQDNRFNIRVVMDEESELSWSESYIGTGFGSTVDYGDTYTKLTDGEMSREELKNEVRSRILKSPRQINFVKKSDNREVVGVYAGVAVVVRQNGYAIYPDPEELVEV